MKSFSQRILSVFRRDKPSDAVPPPLPPPLPALPFKPVIPDFEMIRELGKGSYGSVWLARTVTGYFRAVKVVYRDRFESDQPFNREFESVRKYDPISHGQRFLVAIHHVGRNPDPLYFYYVMDIADDLDGGTNITPDTYQEKTLSAYLRSAGGRLDWEEAINITVSLASGLEFLHGHDLIHRDIKPSNVLFVDGIAKLGDIGLVTSTEEAKTMIGTDGYMPPEGPGTKSADIYALGMVLYQMVTGNPVAKWPDPPAFVSTKGALEPFFQMREVINKAAHPTKDSRYASAEDFRRDLLAARKKLLSRSGFKRYAAKVRRSGKTFVKVLLGRG